MTMERYSDRYLAAVALIESAPVEQLREDLRHVLDLVYAHGAGTQDDPNDIEEYPTEAFLGSPEDIHNCFLNYLPRT